MKAIAMNDKGPEVKKWQFFLHGQGYADVSADGDFGKRTFNASVDFQTKNGLAPNGIIDNATYLKAMQFGFQLVDDHPANTDENSSNWPPPPDFKPLTQSQLQAMFGKLGFTIKPDNSSVNITNGWQALNLVTIEIPQIKALPPYHTNKISVHKKVVPQFQRLFTEWEKAGLSKYLLTFDGSFNPRLIRGSSTVLSNHAFGIAIDINVPWNGLGVIAALKGQKGSVRELVTIANNLGFYWGGHFQRNDGMHFEIAKII
ncbi:MAG: M15 family metallopeptidase [Bacteroidetes bacterium]|nr:M15 family metallopeptidase [Bacteroidota bacterium]